MKHVCEGCVCEGCVCEGCVCDGVCVLGANFTMLLKKRC